MFALAEQIDPAGTSSSLAIASASMPCRRLAVSSTASRSLHSSGLAIWGTAKRSPLERAGALS